MTKVYVVTSGSYSDYGIDAIFSTRDLAQKFIDVFDTSEMQIEEWSLNPHEMHLKQGRKPYFLRIHRDGSVEDLGVENSAYGFRDGATMPTISYTADRKWMNVYCLADDERHAVKIAGEKRIQVLAGNLWGKGG